MKKEEKKTKPVKISEDIHKFLKLHADFEGVSLQALLESILDKWLRNESKFKKEYKEVRDEERRKGQKK